MCQQQSTHIPEPTILHPEERLDTKLENERDPKHYENQRFPPTATSEREGIGKDYAERSQRFDAFGEAPKAAGEGARAPLIHLHGWLRVAGFDSILAGWF